jgi:hypothetical protein
MATRQVQQAISIAHSLELAQCGLKYPITSVLFYKICNGSPKIATAKQLRASSMEWL